ncbi:MAG TPA: hypothetical protein VMC81_03190 [Rhodocyclaceae bacterium]|nr:hypothetical protein [Rhodocyclaceae bacterium]
MPRLALVLLCAAAFVWLTGGSLPPVVASHFSAGGAADGFVARADYVTLMLVLAVGLPLVISMIMRLAALLPVRFINLPNRDYWLAAERREATLAYLRDHGTRLAEIATAFPCFVHWLVVQANAATPAHFPETLFFGGVAAFLVVLALWGVRFIVHFRGR